MKLPRWLVIGLLSSTIVGTVAVSAWWWTTWPERTARDFASLIADGHFEKANDLMTNAQWVFVNADEGEAPPGRLRDVMLVDVLQKNTVPTGGSLLGSDDAWQRSFRNEFTPVPRTFPEVLQGRARFQVHTRDEFRVEWTVERGRIACDANASWNQNAFIGMRW